MFKRILMVLLFSSTASLNAVLPPLYSTANEIKAILNSPELDHHLTSGEPIMEIKRTEKGWLIVGYHHNVEVEVIYQKQEMPGPSKYTFVWHDEEKGKSPVSVH